MPREFKYIARIADTDLDGTKKLAYALTEIKGVGIRLAEWVVKQSSLDPNTRMGFLSDLDIEKLKDIISDPAKYRTPGWFINRSKDEETGKDRHLIGPELSLQIKSDIEKMQRIKSWRGFRHTYGLKVRGQRTRTTGRSKKAVGVKKKRRPTR